MASCGAGSPTCPGPWSSRLAGRSRAIRASSTRPGWRGWLLFVLLHAVGARAGDRATRAARRAASSWSATALARIIGEFFRQPDAQLGFLVGGVTMGQLLSLPMVPFGICLSAGRGRRRSTRWRELTRAGTAASPDHRPSTASWPRRWRSARGYYAGARSVRPCRRLHHRAGDLARLFGELHRALVRRDWHGWAARPGGAGRARPRPRHADGRCAARRPRWSRPSAPRCRPSGGDHARPARRAGRSAGRPSPAWHDGAAACPMAPPSCLANEFFDALPIRQFIRRDGVGTNAWSADGARFLDRPAEAPHPLPAEAPRAPSSNMPRPAWPSPPASPPAAATRAAGAARSTTARPRRRSATACRP